MAIRKLLYISLAGVPAETTTTDEAVLGKLTFTGLSGIAMDGGGARAENFADPANPQDLTTKQYVDDQIAAIGPGGSSGSTFEAACLAGLAVHELVYVNGVDSVALASTNDDPSGHIVGIVESKPTSTTCVVRTSGTVTGMTGLITGSRYFGSPSGLPTTMRPSGTEVAPKLSTQIGIALSTTALELSIDPPIRVKSG